VCGPSTRDTQNALQVTAFAKKVGSRKVQMARFEWVRVAENGAETVISEEKKVMP